MLHSWCNDVCALSPEPPSISPNSRNDNLFKLALSNDTHVGAFSRRNHIGKPMQQV